MRSASGTALRSVSRTEIPGAELPLPPSIASRTVATLPVSCGSLSQLLNPQLLISELHLAHALRCPNAEPPLPPPPRFATLSMSEPKF